MTSTNFTRLTDEEKTVWSRDVWTAARNMTFVNRFMGAGEDAMIQRITELTQNERGARAVITMVPDLVGDGVVGNNTLEGNEEEVKAHDQVVQIDQLRAANRSEGAMAEQRSIVNFREQSRRVLAYWLSDRIDQMAFLALTGVAFTQRTDGPARTNNSQLADLTFAADVVAPSTNRHFNWDQTTTQSFIAGNTATVVATDVPSYEMIVQLKALLKEHYIKPIRGEGDNEMYHVFMSPAAVARLKLDSDFLTNVRQGMPRAADNPLFKGTAAFNSIWVDGLMIHEHRHVFNTRGLTSGTDKWGSGSDVEGCAVLACGAQALGFADIGIGTWVEKEFDYDDKPGIKFGKILGMLKPQFPSIYETNQTQDEDFGVIRINVAV
jgi:N4-gp56 family major capsid protein